MAAAKQSGRHAARILAMQALCVLDSQGDAWLPELEQFLADDSIWNEEPAAEPSPPQGERRRNRATAAEWVQGVWRARERIDASLAAAVSNWELTRLGVVERAVLRLGIYELIVAATNPPAVVINEAVELAKQFGSQESASFVNGVLDAVHRGTSAAAAQQQ